MVQSDQSPVRDNTGDTLAALEVLADDKVLDGSRVHHNHVRHSQNLGEHGGREERRVLDNDEATLVFEGDTKLGEEAVGGLADDLSRHCAGG